MLQKYVNLKEKILKYEKHPLLLGNTSKDFTANSIKKTGLNKFVEEFSVDRNVIDTSNIIDVYKHPSKHCPGDGVLKTS